MYAASHQKFSFMFLFLTSLVSLCGMEQRAEWPILPFVHHKAPTTFIFGPTVLSIISDSSRYDYPLQVEIETLSPMQKIHNLLLQKDHAEHKEQTTFVSHESRFMQFVKQRDQIINLCIECLHGSITAKLQLLELSFVIDGEEKLSEELNTIFHRYLQAIVEKFYNDDGQLKFCTSSDLENAATKIGSMFIEFFPWETCLTKIEGYKNEKVPGFKEFYNNVQSRWILFHSAYQVALDTYKTLSKSKCSFNDLKKSIINNPFNKDLCKLKEAYSQFDETSAYQIVESYSEQNKEEQKKERGVNDAFKRKVLMQSYRDQLIQTSEPIKRLKALQKRHKKSPIVQHVSFMAEKHIARNACRDGSQVGTVLYLISALHRIPQSHVEKSKNPHDQEFADAYNVFFNTQSGLPIIFDYNEEVLKSTAIPLCIGDYGRVKDRLLLFKLASLCVNPAFIGKEKFQESLKNALHYLCRGLRDADHAHTYHLLIEALYNALTNPVDSSLRTLIAECDFLPSPYYMQALHGIVLDHVNTLLNSLEDESLTAQQRLFLHDALSALSRVWVQARDGSKLAEEILSKQSPMTALIEEDFLKVPQNYEKAHNVSRYFQQRMDELGFNKIIIANAYAMSAPALKKIEERCAKLRKHHEVPDFIAIMKIMHDAHTPKPIATLLSNALEIWQTEKSQEVREISVAATLCAEVAYDYHKISSKEYYEIYLGIGNDLCKYAKIAGKVVLKKINKGVDLLYGVVEMSPHLITWCIESAARTTERLLECEERFINGITGRGRMSRNDYFRQKMLLENPPDEKKRIEDAKASLETISMVWRKSRQALNFVTYLAGLSSRETEKESFELQQAILGYLEKFNAMSPEEKFEWNVEFVLDWVICDKVFSIASHLFKILLSHTKEVAQLRKVAHIVEDVEQCDQVLNKLYDAEVALAGAAEEKIIPDILFSKGAPSKAVMSATPPPLVAMEEFISNVINFELKYGKATVDEVMKILKWDIRTTFNKIYGYRVLNKVPQTMSEFLEALVKEIIEIDSKGFKSFRFEDGVCKLKTIEEARAAIACQKQGLLNNLIRDPRKDIGDFIDIAINQTWDVKTAQSFAINGQPIFKEKEQIKAFIDSIVNELTKPTNENVILSIGQLEKTSHEILYAELKQRLSKAELQRIVVVDEFNPLNSKTTQELLKSLGFK